MLFPYFDFLPLVLRTAYLALACPAAYSLRRKPDFDNYYALAQAEDLVAADKAAFSSAASQALREGLDNPREHFRANFLALVSDIDYAKVLDAIA